MQPIRSLCFLVLAGTAPAALAQPGLVGDAGAVIATEQGDGIVTIESPAAAGQIFILDAPPGGAVHASAAADAEGAPVHFSAIPAGPGKAAASAAGRYRAAGNYLVTSGYGYRRNPVTGQLRVHAGVDLAARHGTAIIASSAGKVSQAGWLGGYGLLVTIEHPGGLQTRYGHLSRLAVAPGQAVRRGDVIGFVGTTGRSTGPHLHYEVRVGGQAVNPLPPAGK